MNATVHKPVTRVTPEGFIVDIATNGVIGYKCLGCSTVHVPTEELSYDEFVDFIFHARESHQFCH